MQSKWGALALNVSQGMKMSIIYPGSDEPLVDKSGKEAFLELLSEDSEEGRKFDRKMSQRAIAKLRRQGRKAIEDDDPIEYQVDKIVALLTGWYLVAPDGSAIDIAFSKDAAREMLSDPSMAWLRKQALAFVADGANFTKASSQI